MPKMISIIEFENYSADEPVGLAVIDKDKLPGPIDPSLWDYIPQTLFHRLVSIGEAYKFHFAEITDHVVDSIFNKMQCLSFEEELLFISKIINDPALDAVISKLQNKLAEVKNKSNHVLIISPP